MIECCGAPPDTWRACPSCGLNGTLVDATTVRALLVPAALARLEPQQFRFCAGRSCEVVYFSWAGTTFTATDLQIPVWQKSAPGARTICYCLGENEADMRREIEDTGQTAAIDRVRAQIADNRCACEVRNPRGVCCLGELMAAARALIQVQARP